MAAINWLPVVERLGDILNTWLGDVKPTPTNTWESLGMVHLQPFWGVKGVELLTRWWFLKHFLNFHPENWGR